MPNSSLIVAGMSLAMSLITEFVRAVKEQGGSDEDIHRLVKPEGRKIISQMAMLVVKPTKVFQCSMIEEEEDWMILEDEVKEEAWTLLEDTAETVRPVSDLEPVSYRKEGDKRYVGGEVMRQRAKEMGADFGQLQAEYLLVHQEEILEEWRDYDLLFLGTVWRDPTTDRPVVPYLQYLRSRSGSHWDLAFRQLNFCWCSPRARLLRPREQD